MFGTPFLYLRGVKRVIKSQIPLHCGQNPPFVVNTPIIGLKYPIIGRFFAFSFLKAKTV
jgi:hypothetical protein